MDPTEPTSPSLTPCPRCGRPSAGAFDASGICVRCAGAQIFSQTMTDRPDSAPPIPSAEDFAGPARIGPYTLISELGRGGMGVVYLAQHAQLGRIVALKVIPSGGGATSDLEMRFLREAQTIARLTHPHIVTVHDAGRDRGHAFFAMDYHEEGDLARRLRAQPFAPREAAMFMRSVTEAIAYSHAAGVLHRDLKPSNILLAAGAPRVADFGLASELDSGGGLTAATAVLGTPHYLAPEALSGGSAATGVASDIYSLGVILHEMLAGRTPFAGASPAELPGLLARGEAPALCLLAPQVPRDLATICAKCLEFDPARRYLAAAAIAEDLRRFLAGEPIKARPVSAASQLLRWARRRPALAATWLLSFLLAAASLTAAVLINRERIRADREAAASEALAEFLQKDLLKQTYRGAEADGEVKFRTVLDRAIENIPARFAGAPLAEASLRLSLGTSFGFLGKFDRAEQSFRRALALRHRHLGPKHPETLLAAIELASTLVDLGRTKEAAALISATRAELIRSVGLEHEFTISALETESQIERSLGHISKAEIVARHALALARRVLGPEHELTRTALVNHAALLSTQGKYPEAALLSREAVAAMERAYGPDHTQTLGARVSLLALDDMRDSGSEIEAPLRRLLASLRQKLGPEHPETLRALSNLGTLVTKLGRHAEAVEIHREIVATRTRTRGPEHVTTLLALRNLALAYGRDNHLDEAIVLMRDLTAIYARTLGPTHFSTLTAARNVAAMLLSARRYDEALPIAQATYAASLAAFGPEDSKTLTDEETLASSLGFSKRDAESEPHWRHLVAAWSQIQPDQWHTHMVRGQHGKILARLDRPAEAEPLLRASYDALVVLRPTLPAIRRALPASYAEQLSLLCAASGRAAEAAEWRAKVGQK